MNFSFSMNDLSTIQKYIGVILILFTVVLATLFFLVLISKSDKEVSIFGIQIIPKGIETTWAQIVTTYWVTVALFLVIGCSFYYFDEKNSYDTPDRDEVKRRLLQNGGVYKWQYAKEGWVGEFLFHIAPSDSLIVELIVLKKDSVDKNNRYIKIMTGQSKSVFISQAGVVNLFIPVQKLNLNDGSYFSDTLTFSFSPTYGFKGSHWYKSREVNGIEIVQSSPTL